MFSFTLSPLDASRFHKTHISSNGEDALKFIREPLLLRQHASDIVAEEVLPYLYLHLDGIKIIDSVNHKHVLRFEFRHLEDDAFHL